MAPLLTIDTPWLKNKSPRHIMTQETDLMKRIDKLWEQPMDPRKGGTFAEIRHHFKIIDIESFGYHKWFQDLYKLPTNERTNAVLTKAIKDYMEDVDSRILLHDKHREEKLVHGVKYFTIWADQERNGDYAISNAEVVRDFFQWYLDNKYQPQRTTTNVNYAKHQKIRSYTFALEYVMEVQKWYEYDQRNATKPTDKMAVTTDPKMKKFRDRFYSQSHQHVRATNKTIADSRIVTKVLSREAEEKYIQTFNKLRPAHDRSHKINTTLRQYAILSFNFNLGFRSETASTICYSWMKYHEHPMVAGGIYLNIGNPAGFKQNNASKFRFAQLIVRHVDPRQCPIGSLAKLLVAEHDILKTSVLDLLEKAIDDRERGVVHPSTAWETYRLLHSDNDDNKPISHSTYEKAYKGMYSHIGAEYLRAITHEPHNRVSNKMTELNVNSEAISLFLAWTIPEATEYNRSYSLNLDAQAATARAGHYGCVQTPAIYDCPRDGMDEDFANFPEIRALVLGGRVPNLLERTNLLLPKYPDLLSAQLFLQLLDQFLIRVWLEDAAILQPIFPRSVCYMGHPVFAHPRWNELKAHLRQLRYLRTRPDHRENEEQSPAQEDSIDPTIHAIATTSGDQYKDLKALMNQQHKNPTIASLYEWRQELHKEWTMVNGTMGRGIPEKIWIAAKAMHNRSLYQGIRRLCQYIDQMAQTSSEEDIISRVQQVADSFIPMYKAIKFQGNPIRNFADTQFRILTSEVGENTREKHTLKIDKQKLYAAFRNQNLTEPTPDLFDDE